MTYLFIEPNDVLVFRDGRPFDAGSDHLASGVFPPPPSTVYGSVRSALLAKAGANFYASDFGLHGKEADVLGTASQTGSLRISDVVVAQRTVGEKPDVARRYAPPLDLMRRKTDAQQADGDPEYLLISPQEPLAGVQSNLPGGLNLLGPAVRHRVGTFYEGVSGHVLTEGGFELLLDAKSDRLEGRHLLKTSDVYDVERRTSVALRATTETAFTGTAQEGKLFTVEFVRMHQGCGLLVGVSGDDGLLPDDGALRLGGESRTACFTKVAAPLLPTKARVECAATTGRIKAVVMSPAPFSEGWRPDGFGESLTGRLGDAEASLVGATVARPITLGGWDIAQKRPHRARQAVAPGAVYFFQLARPSDAPAVFAALDGQSLFPADSDDAKKGFGVVRLGTW